MADDRQYRARHATTAFGGGHEPGETVHRDGRRRPTRVLVDHRPPRSRHRHVSDTFAEPAWDGTRRRDRDRVGDGLPTTAEVTFSWQALWLASPPATATGTETTTASFPEDSPYVYPTVETAARGPLAAPAACPLPAESPFKRLVVDYLVEGGARVSWELSHHFTDALPHVFQLQGGPSGLDAGDDWVNIGSPVTNAYFLVDTEKRYFGQTQNWSYRVVLTTDVDEYTSEPAQVWGRLAKYDWLVAREILRQEKLRHKLVSQDGFFLKARRSGTPCPDCLDECTGSATEADCETCYGTRWSGGYYTAAPCWFTDQSNENSREMLATLATTKNTFVHGRMVGTLLVVQGDAWAAYGSDRRYYVHAVAQAAAWRGVPLIWAAELRLAPSSDILYRVPLG